MFTITEPHPTVQANAYTHAGRGGAGNTFRAPSYVTPAEGVPTPITKTTSRTSSASASSASSSSRFYSGRGGAGNACPVSERRSLSLDDELAYAAAVAQATSSGHVGRGGAGNFYKNPTDVNALAGVPVAHVSTADKIAHSLRKLGSGRKGSDASDASSASVGSTRSGFFHRR